LFKDAEECETCVSKLKTQCPNCCIPKDEVLNKRFLACSKDDPRALYKGKFPCKDLAFTLDTCPGPPGSTTQFKACGDSTPKASAGKECKIIAGGWRCDENGLSPMSKGCSPSAGSGIEDCSKYYPNVYNIQQEDCDSDLNPVPPTTTTKKCYEYTLKSNYNSCLQACQKYTKDQGNCSALYDECKNTTCSGHSPEGTSGDPGVAANCKNSPQSPTGKGNCDKRLDWPECDDLTMEDCVSLRNEEQECMSNTNNGLCYKCFKPIDDNFFYRFVTRSREKLLVLWQVNTTRKFQGDVSAYFYTMVKIMDESTNPPTEVHHSISNQKSFQGSFSIFSATEQDAMRESDKQIILKTGKPYKVILCYFIPPIHKGLNVQIDKVQLIVVRTRN
jgi:hypothetical protein